MGGFQGYNEKKKKKQKQGEQKNQSQLSNAPVFREAMVIKKTKKEE